MQGEYSAALLLPFVLRLLGVELGGEALRRPPPQGLFQKAAGAESIPSVVKPGHPPSPETVAQPFSWMETLPVEPLPPALREAQVEGEWDQAY